MTDFEYVTSDLEVLSSLHNYYQWIYQEIQPFLGTHLAEIGPGIGTFTEVLISNHLATDPASRLEVFEPAVNLYGQLVQTLESRHPDLMGANRLVAHRASCSPAGQAFDTVIMVNVLEHIENDKAFTHSICESLKKDGTLVLFVPALPWLYSELDRIVGHWRRYTAATLRKVLEGEQLEVMKIKYMDLIGIMPWYLVNVLGRARTFNPLMTRLYDQILVPISRGIERRWSPVLGKNLLLIGKKTG